MLEHFIFDSLSILYLNGRVLAATEENCKMEQSNLEKLELSVRKLQQELDQLNRDKLSLHEDMAAMQQQLQGRRPHSWGFCLFLGYPFRCLIFLIIEITHANVPEVSFRNDKMF